ncbi:hypothetical protein [Prosthecobacter sp.]|uniref:hypothetical protein n=1 Tax=Prosthecobacter sp. TaxID=1965333 RepID=UPI0037847A0D
MRTILAVVSLFSCTLAVKAADVYPQLNTLDGKTFTQVKVMKVSPTEIRIMHSDGFATITLSNLPPDVRTKYGQADPAAEAQAEQQRKAGNAQAAMLQRQEREALQLMDLTGQSLATLKQAIATRDWCQANPNGGTFNGAVVTPTGRSSLLSQAMEVLNARRVAVVEAPPVPMPGAVPPGAVPPGAVPPGAVPPGAAPAVAGGFIPGTIQLISARYSLPNEAARNVKNRLGKLVPSGVINAPVSILVTDQLSDAALDQGNSTVATGAAVAVTDGTTTAGVAQVVVQEQGRNMLTVEYMYNGQKYKKQAIEGSYLVLP